MLKCKSPPIGIFEHKKFNNEIKLPIYKTILKIHSAVL